MSLLTLAVTTSCAMPQTQISLPVGTTITADAKGARAKASLLLGRAEFALAIEQYRAILRDTPDDRDATEGLALAYDGLRRFDLADRYFQIALALAPRDPGPYRHYAAALRRQGRTGEATVLDQDMRAMIAGAPADPTATELVRATPVATPVAASLPPPPAGPGAVASLRDADRSRLIRVSLGEVRLVTIAPSTSLRAPRIVNAAPRQGIAARMSSYLQQKGWSKLGTGDSGTRLAVSRVIFPPRARAQALRLVATAPFRVEAIEVSKAERVQFLLGDNAMAFDTRLLRAVPGKSNRS
jgi:hypothetical protein